MANAVGPAFVGGLQTFVVNDEEGYEYVITFLPDRANDELQAEGKPAYFYWIPEQVRLARKGGRQDYKFHHTHFVGAFDETNVGIDNGETQGGVLAFTTTSQFEAHVLREAEKELLKRFSGSDERYWGIRSNQAPRVTIAPILSNTTAIMNIAPAPDGSIPQDAGAAGGTTAPAAPVGGGEGEADPRARMRGSRLFQPVPHGRGFRPPTALEPWAWKMEGQGPGSVTGGENAYAASLGPIPSEIIWAGFHGTYSPIVVAQHLRIPVWSPQMHLKITGEWSRIFDHFSAHANARYLWFSADIKAEFNKLRTSGIIKVELDLDTTAPGAGDMEKLINERIDLIVQEFTKQAQKAIFDPPPPTTQPAEVPSGGFLSGLFGGNLGVALKYRRDETYLNVGYEETRHFRYVMPHTISSSLEGFFNEVKQDPANEKKYFTRLVLGELGKKVIRVMKPVVNWPDRTRNWVGHPVAFLSAQVGYPMTDGKVEWKGGTFQSTDEPDASLRPVFVRLGQDEVQNPPPDWTPDKTFLRRQIHLLEPPPESESSFVKVFVERNVVDLDPPDTGSLTDLTIIDVRADAAGMLDVGPITLSSELASNAEIVEVEMRASGTRADGTDRAAQTTRFRWTFADQGESRFWRIFTGQLDYVPAYEYRVHVTVRGTIFNKGQAWSGPWVPAGGNGSLMVTVPGPTDEGVQARTLSAREMLSRQPIRAVDAAPDEDVLPEEEPAAAATGDEVGYEEGLVAAGNGGAGIEAPVDETEEYGEEYGVLEEPIDEEALERGVISRRLKGIPIRSTRSPVGKPAAAPSRSPLQPPVDEWRDAAVAEARDAQRSLAAPRSESRPRSARPRARDRSSDPGEWVAAAPAEE